jgi:hypothetical protein
MDYREIENRMERNRELIKQRAYDRVIAEAKKAQQADQPPRASLIASLRAFAQSLRNSTVDDSSSREPMTPMLDIHSTKKMHPGKG